MNILGSSDFYGVGADHFIADHTGFIKEIIDDIDPPGKVKLFIGPRRLGKSLTGQMLRRFFGNPDDRHLFENAVIWQMEFKQGESAKYQHLQGSYPVISIKLSNLLTDNFQLFIDGFKLVIANVFSEHKKIIFEKVLTNESQREGFQKIRMRTADLATTQSALRKLTELLQSAYNKRVIFLIDEFQSPLNNCFKRKTYDQCCQFLLGVFQALFCQNAALELAFLTGINCGFRKKDLAKLPFIEIHNLLSPQYAKYFGLSETEARKILGYMEETEKLTYLSQLYGGYKIVGESEQRFNTWSFMYACHDMATGNKAYPEKDYWIDTCSEPIELMSLLENPSDSIKAAIVDIFNNKPVYVKRNDKIVFADCDPNSVDDILNFLFLNGYLTFRTFDTRQAQNCFFSKTISLVCFAIPNLEIRFYFYDNFIKRWDLQNRVEKPTLPRRSTLEAKANNVIFSGTKEELEEIFSELKIGDSPSISRRCL